VSRWGMPQSRFPERVIRASFTGDSDPETMRRAVTAGITITSAGLGLLTVAVSFLTFDVTVPVFLLLLVGAGACVPLVVACRRGHVDRAVWAFIVIISVVVVGSTASTGDLGVTPLVIAPISMLLVPILPSRVTWVAPAWALAVIAALWLVTSDAETTQWPRAAWIVLSGILAGVGVVIMSLAAQLVLWAWDQQGRLELTVASRRASADELHVAAHTDSLTGLGNRRALKAFRPHVDGVLVVVDIDDFKAINDLHSHAAGDTVLRDLAASLRAESRAGDALFRLGGDEFMVILADMELADAQAWAVRLALRIGQAEPGVPAYSVTVGMSTCDGPYAVGLIAADEALVAAKRDGRGLGVAPHGGAP
jgi:diguanylate cyclase (GGDEF)-like protein